MPQTPEQQPLRTAPHRGPCSGLPTGLELGGHSPEGPFPRLHPTKASGRAEARRAQVNTCFGSLCPGETGPGAPWKQQRKGG